MKFRIYNRENRRALPASMAVVFDLLSDLREKGYNVLPYLTPTNSKWSAAELQANLVQIKKEKANMLAE